PRLAGPVHGDPELRGARGPAAAVARGEGRFVALGLGEILRQLSGRPGGERLGVVVEAPLLEDAKRPAIRDRHAQRADPRHAGGALVTRARREPAPRAHEEVVPAVVGVVEIDGRVESHAQPLDDLLYPLAENALPEPHPRQHTPINPRVAGVGATTRS